MSRFTSEYEHEDFAPTAAEAARDEAILAGYEAGYHAGPDTVATGGIKCAHCRKRHETVADIRWCADLHDEAKAEAESEAEWEAAAERSFAEAREAQAERGTWFGPETEADRYDGCPF